MMKCYIKNFSLGKADYMRVRLGQMKAETKSSISQGDLIHKKYLEWIKNSPFESKPADKIIFKVNGISYKIHPVYDLHAASKTGNVIHIIKRLPMDGHLHKTGYLYCMVRKYAQKNQKSYQVHQFVWESFNGLIPDGLVIDHVNDIKTDNRLCNLQLMTPQQNNKKAAKNRHYSFVKYNHLNKKKSQINKLLSSNDYDFQKFIQCWKKASC